MIVEARSDDVSCLVCDTVEDYVKYELDDFIKSEQHRLKIVGQVRAEDMKTENTYHGNVMSLNRISTMTLY